MSERKRAPRKELPLHEYNRLFLVEQSYARLKESADKLQLKNNDLIIRNAALSESKKHLERGLKMSARISAICFIIAVVMSCCFAFTFVV